MTDNTQDSANRRIISRMQQRRGLKQDIPQPLRPGEFGFAIDSRQVYIGGDPNDPNAAQYGSVTYFENTTGAIDHTVSIADNQIIAFTVPYIRFDRSTLERREFQWKADFARSTATGAQCFHSGRTKPVFSPADYTAITAEIETGSALDNVFWIKDVTLLDRIRVGDKILGTIDPQPNPFTGDVVIESLTADTDNDRIRVRINVLQQTQAGNDVEIVPASLTDFRTNKPFRSDDIVVSRNSIRLNGDPDPENLERPAPQWDYVIDAENIHADQEHELSLRTRTTVRDQISICYYGQSAIRQAFNGIPRGNDGKSYIAGTSDLESFYSAYDIPEYRRIDDENLRLSPTTGLGYIGLQQKHIATVAEGNTLVDPDSITLGRFLINRQDQQFAVSSVDNPSGDNQDWVITFSDLASENNPFSTVTTNLVRSYNHVWLTQGGGDFNQVLAEVVSVNEGTQQITIRLPASTSNTPDLALLVSPVLAIDLSNVTTLREAVTMINQGNVEFKQGRTARNLFPLAEYVPDADDIPQRNRIFITQNPSFSSVSTGGIDFRLHEDPATSTLSSMGLNPGLYNRQNTVRAKLEEWLKTLLESRDCNLFSSILPLGVTYSGLEFDDEYNIQLDATFGEITFCSREEAANFNFLVNKAYTEALFDRAQDTNDGVRGLVNLRNNVEIQTREGAVIGERISTFIDMEQAFIEDTPGTDSVAFTLPADVYNTYQIEYSISETSDTPGTRYSRVGQMMVIGRPDFDDVNSAAILNDQFSSHWQDMSANPDPDRELVEPQFKAQMTEDGDIQIQLKTQSVESTGAQVRHTVGEELIIKYIVKRWNSSQ